MWREYTRETPARPGWAIVSAGAALALTTSLAWVLAHQGPPGASVGKTVSPPYWPISFALPDDAEPLRQWSRQNLQSDGGIIGAVAYRWGPTGVRHAPRILLLYGVIDMDDDELSQPSIDFFEADYADADEIAMGPMTGHTVAGITGDGNLVYSAMAMDGGLALRIDMTCPPDFPQAKSLFRRICRSVEFVNWYGPADSEHYLNDYVLKLIGD